MEFKPKESLENQNEKVKQEFEEKLNLLLDELTGEKGGVKVEHTEDIGVKDGHVSGRIYNMLISGRPQYFSMDSQYKILDAVAISLREEGLRVFGSSPRIYIVSNDPNSGDKSRFKNLTEDEGIAKENEGVLFHELYNETGMGHLPVMSPNESGKMYVYANGMITSVEPYFKDGELYLQLENGRKDIHVQNLK